MNRLTAYVFALTCFTLCPVGVYAASTASDAATTTGKATGSIKQELLSENIRVGSCNIAAMKVNFRVNESYGQLLVNARMEWTTGTNTPPDCLGENTHIWVTLRTPDGDQRYLKLNPGTTVAGQGFGPSGSTSPGWSALFCQSANDNARCDDEPRTRELIGANPRFEGFTVIAAARSLANQAKNSSSNNAQPDIKAFDSRLSSAINSAFTTGDSSARTKKRPVVANDAASARAAVEKIVTLLGASLSQYTIAAHDCESKRTVSQWVQANGECEVKFRSESQHDFLCEADQQSQPIRDTSNVTINLGKDLAGPGTIKVSDEGWSALVLALKSDKSVHTEAKSNTDRWQITADSAKLDDLEEVARQIDALRTYCSKAN